MTFKYRRDSIFQVGSRLVGLAYPQQSRHSVDPRRFLAPTRRPPFPFGKSRRGACVREIAVCATGLPRSRGLCLSSRVELDVFKCVYIRPESPLASYFESTVG